jgi:recombination protein RecA
VFAGRLGEISGSHTAASLTFAFQLVLEAQRRGEPAAWVHSVDSTFFPPDVDAAGVDLEALAVIRASDALQAARAAEHLLRSGAFGIVVLDIGKDFRMSIPVQSRLAGLARKHEAALICLTAKDEYRASLGPLVSLRVETRRRSRAGDRYRCEVHVLKDKRRGPGWTHVESCRGPDGLC